MRVLIRPLYLEHPTCVQVHNHLKQVNRPETAREIYNEMGIGYEAVCECLDHLYEAKLVGKRPTKRRGISVIEYFLR